MLMVMAGFGAEGGSDDEEKDAADSQCGRDDLPMAEGGRLLGDPAFEEADFLLGLIERIRSFGKPACVDRGKGPKQADEEDEMFHWVMRGWGFNAIGGIH